MKKISAALLLCGLAAVSNVHAGAVHDANLFTANNLGAIDDTPSVQTDLKFNLNFFGVSTNKVYVNNNGNVTFDAALDTYTPFGLKATNTQILAAFFADVDTRGNGSGVTQFGTSTLNGRNVFGVNWIDVGYYNGGVDRKNSFQLIITDRSDIGLGDFDFEFNYDKVQWEAGNASNGSGGLGGNSARVGWSNGNSANSFELAGSAVNGAFLDAGANSLVNGSLNSNVAGRYNFNVRNGAIVTPTIPEPSSMLLVAIALAGVGAMSRRRKV
jgi:hypothetical protein